MPRKSHYSSFQQSISYLLIFAILFINSFEIPFFEKTKAEGIKNIELISVIVHENVYNSLQSRINRYAEDVQAKLNNTKVLIYKVPADITPQKIAALNEKLFYEGDGTNDSSKLVGTILVGDIPLPVMHDSNKTFLSIYPYIDFNEKNFIYNNESGFYEKSSETAKDLNPEIWHSIIAPNTGDDDKDKIKLIDFFDKDHSYYTKSGVFATSLQEPYVFYYDGKRDESAASYSLRKGYELYIKNIEDIAYNRFNKYLSKQLNEAFYANPNSELSGALLQAGIDNPELKSYIDANLGGSGIDTSNSPDVMTKSIIDKLTKKFFQVFNEKYIGDILKYVYNTGRYGNTNNTRADTIISLISKRDNGVKVMLKDINTVLEDYIYDVLSKGAARNIAIPTKVEESKHYRYSVASPIGGGTEGGGATTMICLGSDTEGNGYSTKEYKEFAANNYVGVLENYYYGLTGDQVKKAQDCSIYRGTRRTTDNKSLLVEATRAQNYDRDKTQADTALLQSSPDAQTCFAGGVAQTMGFWGGYSIFNMDTSGGTLKLGPTDYRRATKPIYDIAGGVAIGYNSSSDTQDTKKDVANKDIIEHSTNSCLEFNWMYTNPNNLSPGKSACNNKMSEHKAPYSYEPYSGNTLEDIFRNSGGKVYFGAHSYDYHNSYVYLDGKLVKSSIGDTGGCDKYIIHSNYYFKKVLGVVEHKSPTDEEFGAQLKNMATPSLPSDRNRYVDFVSAKGNQKKFEYPNLFRINIPETNNLNYEYVKTKVKEYLDGRSSDFNKILTSENPAGLSGVEKEIYDNLKVANANYTTSIDFYSLLGKDSKVLDEVIKSVLWANLNSTALRYKYILENYLDIDGNTESLDTGHRSDYEIAYIGGKGDATNLYLGIDLSNPKNSDKQNKATNALSRYNQLKNILSANKIGLNGASSEFKCGPPDGVPIFQWFPAIMCRLKTLVPPIAIEGGSCGAKTLGIGDSNTNSSGLSTDFGGEFPKMSNPIYQEDKNGNGIPDGAELINNGKISLISDKGMYSYNKNIRIKANLFYDGKIIGVDNTSKVSFDIVRLISYKDKAPEVIYERSSDDYESKKDEISQYINFVPVKVRVNGGVANYAFSSNGGDVDLVLRATISTLDKNGQETVHKESNNLTIKVRGFSLEIASKVNGVDTSNIKAGETDSINFQIKTLDKDGKQITNEEPFSLNVYDYDSSLKIGEEQIFNTSNFNYSSPILKKTGEYRFVIKDAIGIEESETITVGPAAIKSIKLTPSSTQIVKGNTDDILVELNDIYGNRPKGDLYNITGKITGDGVFDSNSSDELKVSVLDGFANFKIRSTGGAGNINIKFSVDSEQAESSILTINVVDYAKVKLNIEDSSNIVVGKDKHKISLSIVDGNNNLLSNFNGVAYFDFNEINGVISPNFVNIVNGKPIEDIYIIPNFVAAKNLTINTTVSGIEDVEGNKVTILPDKPMYVGLQNTRSKLEAKSGNKATIKAMLYDRYSNIVFNDSSHSVNFYIPEEYKKYTEFGTNNYSKTTSFSEGVAYMDAFATPVPGSAYILAQASPALENNSVVIKGENDQELTASGVSENAVLFNTYYLFNKEKLDNINYNALYTVLQGANYGDITQQGYLGGEILFNKGSRSLAVSSIINNPYTRETAFGFTPGGKFIGNSTSNNDTFSLESEINSNSNGTAINLYDSVYKELIARAWLNFDSNTELVDCGVGTSADVGACSIPTNSSYIMLKGINGVKTQKNPTSLSLYLNNFKIFDIDSSGRINKDPGISIKMDENSSGNMLGMKLIMNKAEIGYLGMKFKTNSIDVFDSSSFPNILYNHKNQIVIEKISNEYYNDSTFLGISSHGAKGVIFYKNDSSDNENVDKDMVSAGDKTGLENYAEQAGIGWEGKNKMLLEFAGGNSVGDSTKFYQTYSMINLGDPVISLDTKAQPNSDFDRSIGKKLTEEKGSAMESYKKIDFNGDGSDDIVVFYEDGHIELLANYSGNFKNMGYLAYIANAGKLRKGVGDFSGDKFDDIVFVNNKGKIGILNNIKSKFIKQTPVILNEKGNQELSIDGQIEQLEVFDMDKDGKDDIVTVDDGGDLSILYGTSGDSRYPGQLVFNKKVIDNALGMKMKTNVIKTGGALFFDSIPQISDFSDQAQYVLQSKEAKNNLSDDTASNDGTYSAMLNKLIFYQEKYQENVTNTGVTEAEKRKILETAVGTDETGKPNPELANEIINSQKDLVIMNGSGMTNVEAVNNSILEKTRTFIRSQYAGAYNIDVAKTYKDVNGSRLQAGDVIEVTLRLANNSTKKAKDIRYYDSNKNFLKSDNSSYTIKTSSISETRALKENVDGEFDYSFDNFSINPGDTATIVYNLVMPNVSFGLITVGVLEKNDSFGDIALNPTSGCGDDQIIWASVAEKTYKKGKRKFQDTSKLPDQIEKNKVDEDGNGIPDYIDELNGSGSLIQQFAKEQLSDFNKDTNNNGIPDKDEASGNNVFTYNGAGGNVEMTGLNVSNLDMIDSVIDTVVNGLGCGFGGGACITSPLNRAPLAPGSSPTLFGEPVSPGLMSPSAGYPLFSALTGNQTTCGDFPCCLPTVWPASKKAYVPGPFCGPDSAGGKLGTWAPTNFFRIFVTPTITGAIGTAICFGGPAKVVGYIPPKGVFPFIQGGNCIIAAVPLGCKNDGTDGNVGSQWVYKYNMGNNFFNSNSCVKSSSNTPLSADTNSQITKYLQGDSSLAKSLMNGPLTQHSGLDSDSDPIIGIGSSGGFGDGDSLDISIDSDALKNLDIDNIVKIDFKRVSSFPDFIMDWVTRQIEEIANKLVTLPTLYIILPDFSGLADSGWNNFSQKYNDAKADLKKKEDEENKKKEEANKKNTDKPYQFGNETLQNGQNYLNEKKTDLQKSQIVKEAKGGISSMRSAYEVISTLPLIKLDQEQVNVTIPWIGPEELDKWIKNAEGKVEDYKNTIKTTKNKWGDLAKNPSKAVGLKALLDADKLVNSVEKNIKTLKEYKKFPSKFRKYLTWKEVYLAQILCNVQIINKVTGGRIKDNGKRFRTWVELIILLKAILKSWQLIVDVFAEFNDNCAVCHNERYDLKHSTTKLVSALVPKLPIIIFPKWPDIIIDLHNIRAGLNITLPEFSFKVKPIVLPQLPDLTLPDTPNFKIGINLSLPSIGSLPSLPELPDLPELPSLPNIKLPDLPPPPKIPKMFSAIELMLQLIKLISKIICLWNHVGNFLTPEWRAGDAIAWITERNGVSKTDKLFIDMPNIAVSFIDAIKITSYVNLEFDVEFILEMAKSTLEPFNKFSNDLSNINKGTKIPSIDFNGVLPAIDDININLNKTGTKPQSYNNQKNSIESYIGTVAGFAVGGLLNVSKTLQAGKNDEVDIKIFKQELSKHISTLAISSNPKEKQIFNILNDAINFDASSENKFIEGLSKNNDEKFDNVVRLIKEYQKENNALNKELTQIEKGEKSILDFSPIKNNFGGLKVVANYNSDYKKQLVGNLGKQEDRFLAAVKGLGNNNPDKDAEEIKRSSTELIDKIKLNAQKMGATGSSNLTEYNGTGAVSGNYATTNNDSQTSSDYAYNYQGIYVTNKDGKQTRLFEYLDEIDSKSNVVELDSDKDGDKDVIYAIGGSLYYKKNLSKKSVQNHFSDVESTRDIGDINNYLNISSSDNIMPFAPNYFEETIPSAGSINFKFASANRNQEKSFRLEYYDYIERFDFTNNVRWYNKGVNPYARMNLVDLVTTNVNSISEEKDGLTIRNSFATIGAGVGTIRGKIPDYKILISGNSLSVQNGKTIYAGDNGLTIKYKFDGNNTYKIQRIGARQNIEFLDRVDVTVLDGSMFLIYDSTIDYSGDISVLRGMPVLPGYEIYFENNNGYANIEYNGGGLLTVDNGSSYRMISLGEQTEMYYVNIESNNEFYYAKLYSFNNSKRSNIADLTLMSPQVEADNEDPLITLDDGIRLPVYKQKTFNLKKYITDSSGIKNIYIDADITKDSSGDGISDNDKDSLDTKTTYGIKKGNTIFDIIVGPFDKLINKKVMLYAVDNNDNTTATLIDFEVYAPLPEIKNVTKEASFINGNIDETIDGEPIDIFRYRDNVLSKIDTKDKDNNTDDSGVFGITGKNNDKGLILSKQINNSGATSSGIIANINETTGKIDMKDNDYGIRVKGAGENIKTTIEVYNKTTGITVYEQSFNLPSNQIIQQVSDFSNVNKGIFFKSNKDGYSIVNNSSSTPYLPNGAYIVDNNHSPIIGVGSDGNIYIMNSNYTLSYDTYSDYIVIKVNNSAGENIGSLMFKLGAFYILK